MSTPIPPKSADGGSPTGEFAVDVPPADSPVSSQPSAVSSAVPSPPTVPLYRTGPISRWPCEDCARRHARFKVWDEHRLELRKTASVNLWKLRVLRSPEVRQPFPVDKKMQPATKKFGRRCLQVYREAWKTWQHYSQRHPEGVRWDPNEGRLFLSSDDFSSIIPAATAAVRATGSTGTEPSAGRLDMAVGPEKSQVIYITQPSSPSDISASSGVPSSMAGWREAGDRGANGERDSQLSPSPSSVGSSDRSPSVETASSVSSSVQAIVKLARRRSAGYTAVQADKSQKDETETTELRRSLRRGVQGPHEGRYLRPPGRNRKKKPSGLLKPSGKVKLRSQLLRELESEPSSAASAAVSRRRRRPKMIRTGAKTAKTQWPTCCLNMGCTEEICFCGDEAWISGDHSAPLCWCEVGDLILDLHKLVRAKDRRTRANEKLKRVEKDLKKQMETEAQVRRLKQTLQQKSKKEASRKKQAEVARKRQLLQVEGITQPDLEQALSALMGNFERSKPPPEPPYEKLNDSLQAVATKLEDIDQVLVQHLPSASPGLPVAPSPIVRRTRIDQPPVEVKPSLPEAEPALPEAETALREAEPALPETEPEPVYPAPAIERDEEPMQRPKPDVTALRPAQFTSVAPRTYPPSAPMRPTRPFFVPPDFTVIQSGTHHSSIPRSNESRPTSADTVDYFSPGAHGPAIPPGFTELVPTVTATGPDYLPRTRLSETGSATEIPRISGDIPSWERDWPHKVVVEPQINRGAEWSQFTGFREVSKPKPRRGRRSFEPQAIEPLDGDRWSTPPSSGHPAGGTGAYDEREVGHGRKSTKRLPRSYTARMHTPYTEQQAFQLVPIGTGAPAFVRNVARR